MKAGAVMKSIIMITATPSEMEKFSDKNDVCSVRYYKPIDDSSHLVMLSHADRNRYLNGVYTIPQLIAELQQSESIPSEPVCDTEAHDTEFRVSKDTCHVSANDNLRPAYKLEIVRSVHKKEGKAQISHLADLPLERLQTLRDSSIAAEEAIYEKLRMAAGEWEKQAVQTISFENAIQYIQMPPPPHTANQWEHPDAYRYIISNMVYLMSYSVSERESYRHTGQKPAPIVWDLTWGVYTNAPDHRDRFKIDGQTKKIYKDKAEMERYLAKRIQAYAHLFTELSPPIPSGLAKYFSVNGLLLPGYTVEEKE
jgi:hypothetical protein